MANGWGDEISNEYCILEQKNRIGQYIRNKYRGKRSKEHESIVYKSRLQLILHYDHSFRRHRVKKVAAR